MQISVKTGLLQKEIALESVGIYLDEHPGRFYQADKVVLYVGKVSPKSFCYVRIETAGERKTDRSPMIDRWKRAREIARMKNNKCVLTNVC